jgi:hypothetical protein
VKLSDKQVQALRAIDAGSVFGFYRSGNLVNYLDDNGPSFAESTVRSLRNRGLVENADTPVVTDAGKALLQALESQ